MKKRVSLFIILAILCQLSLGNIASADVIVEQEMVEEIEELTYGEANKNTLSQEYLDAINIFLENGYSENDIKDLTLDLILELAEDIKENPNSVDITTSLAVVDNIESLELVVNLDTDEIMEYCDVDKKEALAVKENVEHMQEMTTEELQETYNLSEDEILIIEEVLEPQEIMSLIKK